MEFKNEELEKEIDLFFNESKENLDQILDELGLDAKQVCPDESEQFLVKRAEILKNFEKYLFKKCTILKDLEQNENDLNDLLIEKINNLVNDEKNVNSELKKLETEKENLREMLEVKSNLIKESIDKKKEVERICNGNVKEEFVSLCKFMNLKFQWNQTNKKFTIVFLSSSSNVNQVKQINGKKLIENDEKYLKELREHFKLKILQLIE